MDDCDRVDARENKLTMREITDAAARFYRHHGLPAFSGRVARMFLPVATARRVVEG